MDPNTQSMLLKYGLEGMGIATVSAFMNGTPILSASNLQTGLMSGVIILLVDTLLTDYATGFRLGVGWGLGGKMTE